MIRLIKSTFYQEEDIKKTLVDFIQNSEILSFNKECQKFEKKFAKWQGCDKMVFVNSGSSVKKLPSYRNLRSF